MYAIYQVKAKWDEMLSSCVAYERFLHSRCHPLLGGIDDLTP